MTLLVAFFVAITKKNVWLPIPHCNHSFQQRFIILAKSHCTEFLPPASSVIKHWSQLSLPKDIIDNDDYKGQCPTASVLDAQQHSQDVPYQSTKVANLASVTGNYCCKQTVFDIITLA